MKWASRVKPNVFFYIGLAILVINGVVFDFNFVLSLLGTALLFFSETFTNSMNRFLKGSH